MKTVVKENANGGKGQVVVKYILDDNELNAKCKMFAEVTIAPGCSLGYHEHHGESETYYIIKGQGEYDDNGTKRPVTVGDKTFTPDGCGHICPENVYMFKRKKLEIKKTVDQRKKKEVCLRETISSF